MKKYHEGSEIIAVRMQGSRCGVFIDKIPGLDTVSIGPDIFFPHDTPEEHLSIPSISINLLGNILFIH